MMSCSLKNSTLSKNFNFETKEMSLKGKMSINGEKFTQDTLQNQNPCNTIIGDIEIKYEEVEFPFHNSTSDSMAIDLDNIAYVDCGSVNTEQKDLNEFFQELLQCERDCDTCQNYMRKLRQHIRASHSAPQPIEDPLLIDPLNFDHDPSCDDQSSSFVQIKSEVDDGMDKMECSEQMSKTKPECDPDFELENESESDPEYIPSTPYTKKVKVTKGQRSIKKHTSKKSKSMESNLIKIDQYGRKLDCNVCGKSFERLVYLKIHMLVHTGEKEFKCEVCEKSFSVKGGLIAHMRIHTGEKPFQCDMCRRSFTQKIHLVTHKRLHTGERPYGCDECPKRFTSSSHVTHHKKIHT